MNVSTLSRRKVLDPDELEGEVKWARGKNKKCVKAPRLNSDCDRELSLDFFGSGFMYLKSTIEKNVKKKHFPANEGRPSFFDIPPHF
jgi:hypothetical protein